MDLTARSGSRRTMKNCWPPASTPAIGVSIRNRSPTSSRRMRLTPISGRPDRQMPRDPVGGRAERWPCCRPTESRATLPDGFEGRIFSASASCRGALVSRSRTSPRSRSRRCGRLRWWGRHADGPDDIFAVLFEYGPESVGKALFARQGMQRSLGTDDFRLDVAPAGPRGSVRHAMVLHRGGTSLYLLRRVREPCPTRSSGAPGQRPARCAVGERPTAFGQFGSGSVELIGLYLVGCALLVCAGVMKAGRPDDTARALVPLVPGRVGSRLHFRQMRTIVRVAPWSKPGSGLPLSPAPAGAWPGSWPPPISSSPVWWRSLGRRGGALASCGCFGTPDTPATLLHVGSTSCSPSRPSSSPCRRHRRHAALALGHRRSTVCRCSAGAAVGAWLTFLTLSCWRRAAARAAVGSPARRR